MLKRIRGEYYVIIASRYVMGGGIEEWSLWRKVMSKTEEVDQRDETIKHHSHRE